MFYHYLYIMDNCRNKVISREILVKSVKNCSIFLDTSPCRAMDFKRKCEFSIPEPGPPRKSLYLCLLDQLPTYAVMLLKGPNGPLSAAVDPSQLWTMASETVDQIDGPYHPPFTGQKMNSQLLSTTFNC